MPLHDFATLRAYYPELIAQMPDIFTSHEFILRLAQQYQTLYVEALYSYRNTTHEGTPAPFMNVHRELSKQLSTYPALVEYVDSVNSEDIFGQFNKSARWRRVRQ